MKLTLTLITGLTFIALGANHFRSEAFYLRMMPPWIPAPRAMVILSGIAEILGGLGLAISATRPFAAWGLIAMLIAIFPANLHMALNTAKFADVAPAWLLYARLPFQPLFIAWVCWLGLKS